MEEDGDGHAPPMLNVAGTPNSMRVKTIGSSKNISASDAEVPYSETRRNLLNPRNPRTRPDMPNARHNANR